MANEAVRLRRDEQVFSSLPRRNAMEPGHLHKNKEALLACPAIALGDGG